MNIYARLRRAWLQRQAAQANREAKARRDRTTVRELESALRLLVQLDDVHTRAREAIEKARNANPRLAGRPTVEGALVWVKLEQMAQERWNELGRVADQAWRARQVQIDAVVEMLPTELLEQQITDPDEPTRWIEIRRPHWQGERDDYILVRGKWRQDD